MDSPYSLPDCGNLDIGTFSRLLDDTKNSYKFLFFLSLLDILSSRFFKTTSSISLQELAIEMLVNAWYPHSVFRLSFGLQDKVADELDRLRLHFNESILKITENNKITIREAIKNKDIDDKLIRYVPFRLIRPFFKQLRGLKDQQVNSEVKNAADILFEDNKPLYKFNQDATAILVHPEWAYYIQINYQVIRGWTSWKWLQYMQKKNPNTPAIVNKLFPPRERESLQRQTYYWRTVIENSQDLRCIYSNQILDIDDISLDHYLPWSFVAHNQLWNLIPVPKSVNSSKSDNIPNNVYFEKFIHTQHIGLTVFHSHSPERKWNNYIESYLVDLGFSDKEDLLNLESLRNQYELKLKPLIALAVSQGFNSDWKYI
jgi:hypothetical protein